MAKVIGVITARMFSKRLPGKVMEKVVGKTLFAHHVERLKSIPGIDSVFLATSKDPLNKELIEEAERLGCGWYAGAEQDVVERHVELCEREAADAFVRVPCDSPIFDIESASLFVKKFKDEYRDYIYVSNMTMIQGTVKELVSYNALCKVHKYYRGPAVTLHIIENMDEFKTLGIEVDVDLVRPEYRLTVDHPVDLELIRQIYETLYNGEPLTLRDVYVWLDDNPKVAYMNKDAEVSGINKYIGNLMDKPLYSIIASGKAYSIIDQQGQVVDPVKFISKLSDLFPELNESK